MYLADDESTSSNNVFKNNKSIPIKDIRARLTKLPIFPVYMDTKTSVPHMLALCPHWNNNMESDWIKKKEIKNTYDLVNWRIRLQEEYLDYTAEFVTLQHELRSFTGGAGGAAGGGGKDDGSLPDDLSKRTFELVLRGFHLLGDMTAKVREQVAWKFDNPITDNEYKELGGQGGPYQVYEQVTRFNFGNDLKYAMVEVIGLIKGLSNMLSDAETIVRPIVSDVIHEKLQRFTHNTLLLPLFRSNKKKKGDLKDVLLTMRLVAADAYDCNLLREDFNKSKEKELKKLGTHKWPKRSVFPTRTQILLLRRLMFHISSDSASGMKKSGLFGDKDLKKDEVSEFKELYNLLPISEYMSNFQNTIKECSDLSDLWFREFYLDMTGCIQFPIDVSLPWMLTDFAMNTPALAPNVFFPIAIYNDCAEQSLSVFQQQFLFDEIEAEVNLVFDQLIFTLYRKIFDHYKNVAAKILLDNPFQRRMEEVRNKLGTQMMLNHASFEPIFEQRHIVILGRTIDISQLLTEQLNIHIRDNIDTIISRLESSSITAVIEVSHLLDTLRLTTYMLSQELKGLDSFDDVLNEINEDTTLGSFRGRLFLTVHSFLFNDLLQKFVYNSLTRRFVSHEKPKVARKVEPFFLWGSKYTQVYQQIFKVTRGFLGAEHISAIINLMGIDSMPLLIDEMVKTCAHIVVKDISPYVTEILGALDPMKQQPAMYGVLGVFGYYDLIMQYIKSYPALREHVFTLLREAGNALCLTQLVDMVLTHESFYNSQIQSFYLGVEPARLPYEAMNQDDVKYSSAAAQMARPKESPFVNIMKETLANLNNNSNQSGGGSGNFKREEELIQSAINNAIRREAFLRHNSGGWLFSACLDYLYNLLTETGLLKEWKGENIAAKNNIIDNENPKDFARFWSVATFIFLCPDFNFEDKEEVEQYGDYISDASYFGDGWLWAGTTILFLTGLEYRYRLFDPTIYIDKLQRLYPEDLNTINKKSKKKKKGIKESDTERYKPFVRGLLQGWKEMEHNVDLINSVLHAHFQPIPQPITKFSPIWKE